MTDIAIQPVSLSDYGKTVKFIPADLVVLEGSKKGSEEYFIATKSDHSYINYSKFVGFYTDGTKENIILKYGEIIEATPITNYVEIMFPLHRVREVRSLVYRHKGK
jgi:hypothetical protein